jgi:uncharacterized protein with PQ loop repeat
MGITDVLAVVAGSFGVVMGASPLLQVVRMWRRGASDDVSVPFLLILFAGGMAWLAYGIALGNPALIAGNVAGVSASGTAVAVALVLRARARTEIATLEALVAEPAEPRRSLAEAG